MNDWMNEWNQEWLSVWSTSRTAGWIRSYKLAVLSHEICELNNRDVYGECCARRSPMFSMSMSKSTDLLFVHAKVCTVMLHKCIIFNECTFVTQKIHPLPRSQLSLHHTVHTHSAVTTRSAMSCRTETVRQIFVLRECYFCVTVIFYRLMLFTLT